jgi:cellulose 1,4-beta-cellobiosidase
LTVTSSGHHRVSLSWNAASAAKIYSISRTTLYPDGAGNFNPLRTIIVNDAVTSTTYTDTTPTDGKTYSYYVKGINTIGSSAASTTVMCTPLPAAPFAAPGAFSGARESDATKIDLTWSPVTGATGYVIYRSTTSGSFPFPDAFVTTTVRTKYTDSGLTAGTKYYYRVSAVNSAGVSGGATTSVQ